MEKAKIFNVEQLMLKNYYKFFIFFNDAVFEYRRIIFRNHAVVDKFISVKGFLLSLRVTR